MADIKSHVDSAQEYVRQFVEDNKHHTIFTPSVDLKLDQVPSEVWDTLAVFGILFGVALAFAGGKMLKLAIVTFGFMVGGFFAALLLTLVEDVNPNVWIGVVTGSSIVMAILVDRIVILGKFAIVVALGVAIAGIFNQYALGPLEEKLTPPALIATLVVCIGLSALLIWKAFDFGFSLAMCVVGGFIVLASAARLSRESLSFDGIYAHPSSLFECEDMKCWGPLLAGCSVTGLGLAYQLVFAVNKISKKEELEQPLIAT
jgi:uncharacterized membrane protein YfbV (UPF0208 family)